MKTKKVNLKKSITKSHIFEVYPATIVKVNVGIDMPSIFSSFEMPPIAYFTFKFHNKGRNKIITTYSAQIDYSLDSNFMKLCYDLYQQYDAYRHLILSDLIGKKIKLKIKIETENGKLKYSIVDFEPIQDC